MRLRVISFAVFSSLLLVSACNRTEPQKAGTPSAPLIVAGEAKNVSYSTNNGADLVTYNLKVDYPATGVIQEITSKLAKEGYKPLKESFLNPGIPSSMERGWSEYTDATKDPKRTVHQWNTDWSNSDGEIVSYMISYEYSEGKEKNMVDLEVSSIHMKGNLAQNIKRQGDDFIKKQKDEEVVSRGKGGVSENLKFYLTQNAPGKGLTEVTLPTSQEKVHVEKAPVITSSDIATVKTNEVEGGYELRLDLNAEGWDL